MISRTKQSLLSSNDCLVLEIIESVITFVTCQALNQFAITFGVMILLGMSLIFMDFDYVKGLSIQFMNGI